jgi:hypothetical protein
MSSGLAYSQIDDAVLLTQEKLIKRGAFVDMQTDLQDHVAVREMWKQRKKKFEGGDAWEWQIQMDHNHSAQAVGLFETDGSALADTMVTASIQVRHVNAHYIYDQREKDFQRGGTKIVDLVKTRYVGMMVSFYEILEGFLWSKPVSDADLKTPYGIDYWITKYNATVGFGGGNPSGFTSGKAGISQGTYPRWANWTDRYAAITKADLIRKMRQAHTKTKFRSVVSHSTPDFGPIRNGIYSPYSVIGLVEEELEKQNMSLGNDVASKDGRALFRGTPLTWVPKLDASTITDAPVYMLDWKSLVIGVMAGWENNLTAPYMVPNKHLVRRVDLDASLNMVCTDLRSQAVLNTSG